MNQAVASPDPVWGDVYLTPAFRINTPPTFKFVASGQSIKADWAGLLKGFVGLCQINVRLPDRLADRTQGCPGGNLNVRFLFGTGVPQEDLNSAESVDICASMALKAPVLSQATRLRPGSEPERYNLEGV